MMVAVCATDLKCIQYKQNLNFYQERKNMEKTDLNQLMNFM